MKNGIGVWIDHRKALIIGAAAAEGGRPVAIRTITTDLEKQLRLSSGERAKAEYGPQQTPSDDMRETSSQSNMRDFFENVVAAVRGADAIFVLGPGEAKEEFRKCLERDGLGKRIDGVETSGMLSDRQLAAKVRAHFKPHRNY